MFAYFLSPKGRFRRRDYWFGMTVVSMILALGLGADFVLRGVQLVLFEGPSGGPGEFNLVPAPLFFGVAGVLILWPSLAMGIKRWHDRDRSGWWVLLSFIPIVNIYAYISMFLLSGTPGINRFGLDPRDEEHGLYGDKHHAAGAN
ncbi:MAG: DUF805 domain-containing protein [Devosiaceae bacterium]